MQSITQNSTVTQDFGRLSDIFLAYMLHQNVYVILVAEDAVAPCTVERGREIGTCLRLILPLQQDGTATLKDSLPAAADKVHGTQTVKKIGDAHKI